MNQSTLPHGRSEADQMSSEELCRQYREHALRVRSVAKDTADEEVLYLKRLLAYFDAVETPAALFTGLSPSGISGFLNVYAADHGPGSRRWMQMTLRSFLRFAHQQSYLGRDQSGLVPSVRKWRMGQVPKALPGSCIAALRTGIARDTPAGLRDSAIVCLLAVYGVRGVQIRHLRLDQINWRNDRLFFSAAKGGRSIEQYLTAEAGNLLTDYLVRGRPQCSIPEVFLTLEEPYRALPSSSYLSGMLHRHMDRLGLEPPAGVSRGAHGFRHALAIRMTGRVPFKDVMDTLGHRDPGSTLVYGKAGVEDLRSAALPWPGGAL